MPTTSIVGRKTARPKKGSQGVVKFALYKRGNPKFRNFHAILDADAMKHAGLEFKDPCDLRFSDDLRTAEIIRNPVGPAVTIQRERTRGVLRTRLAVDRKTPEFQTTDAVIRKVGAHRLEVSVPPAVRRTLKHLSH